MKRKSTKLFAALFALVALSSMPLYAFKASAAGQKQTEYTLHLKDGSVVKMKGPRARSHQPVRFTVRVENISSTEGQTASNGEKWPFALSPGMWVVHRKEVRLFNEGRPAILGLEAQAEDGNPSGLVDYLMSHHDQMQHGVFNTPGGAGSPAPIGPGGAYEFSFSAEPGMKLSMITMFGQSNDWFYAPAPDGIDLFDDGRALGGDITGRFFLYDAGTEVDQEPGIGPDQAPRQKAPNTGAAENGTVHKARKSAFYTKTKELFRVTLTPEMMP